jgi:NitT/TauT family transport system substrate-binding protein
LNLYPQKQARSAGKRPEACSVGSRIRATPPGGRRDQFANRRVAEALAAKSRLGSGQEQQEKNKEDDMKRSNISTAWLALLMSVAAGAPAAHALDKVKVIIPQNSVFVLTWMGARDAGVFRKHGIDIDIDARPFAGFLAGLPSRACMVTTYAGFDAILKMTQGMDLAVIGGGLTVFQELFVPRDSPIKSVADLRGKRFGAFSTGAGAFKSIRAAVIDGYHLDILKDTHIVQVAAPALYKLAEQGKVDAMFNISSFTIKAASEPDKFRSIYSANAYWKKKTGYPIVWSGPLVAWRDWVEENPTRAKHLAAAVEESFRRLRKPENLDAVVKKYGKLGGVTTPEAVATYKKWLGEKKLFLAHWDRKAADAEWAFLKMAKQYGVLDKVPSEKDHALLLGN